MAACAVCEKETLLRCSGCGVFTYCSDKHQKTDWLAGHNDICGKMREFPADKKQMPSSFAEAGLKDDDYRQFVINYMNSENLQERLLGELQHYFWRLSTQSDLVLVFNSTEDPQQLRLSFVFVNAVDGKWVVKNHPTHYNSLVDIRRRFAPGMKELPLRKTENAPYYSTFFE